MLGNVVDSLKKDALPCIKWFATSEAQLLADKIRSVCKEYEANPEDTEVHEQVKQVAKQSCEFILTYHSEQLTKIRPNFVRLVAQL